ncbi:LysR family transcriptional regulator ArgP [Actinocrinis puniceicyclus]|uniref:LysR family transcriptional regulator ArgP n=1 Tax=Actinocrinis puniceicyclus TaxID=977794 RepID=UPI001FE6ACB2|nr:LysR family transcriptional regulator ArgP [Actinocrinis puniceicyclus]
MEDLPLDQVRTLLAAVDEGTFEAAARALHVTPSAVSQRIKALEQRTGRVLLVRSKPVRPTESGLAVVRFARQLAALERGAAAELGLRGANGPAILAIAVNADSLATWFLEALAEALAGNPAICFELHREDQDHTDQLLRQGLVMAAVSSSPHPVQGCTVRKLGRMRYRAMATREFAERWLTGAPLTQALADAPVVVFNRKDELQDRFLRSLGPRLTSGPRHHVPASDAFFGAVAAGFGWGMLPDLQVAQRGAGDPVPVSSSDHDQRIGSATSTGVRPEHPRTGSYSDGSGVRPGDVDQPIRHDPNSKQALVEIAPDHPVDVPLYWQQWKLGSPALAAVGEAVIETAARVLAR